MTVDRSPAHPPAPLVSLQVLRAVAALCVVCEHSYSTFHARLGLPAPLQTQFWALSGLGVDLFFAISGFIMMQTSRQAFGRPGASRGFLLRRIWRIVPLYWLMTMVEAAKLWTTGGAITGQDLVLSLLFIPYRNAAGLVHPVLEAGWTLDFEMAFYLVFAAALVLPRRAGVTALLFGLGALVAWGGLAGPQAGGGVVATLAGFASRPIVLFFLVGIGVWHAWRPGARFRVSAGAWTAVLLALVAIGVAVGAQDVDRLLWPSLPLVGAILLAALSAPAFRRGGVVIRGVVLLGDASYSLYLTHSFLLGPAGRLAERFALPGAAWRSTWGWSARCCAP